ncbi:MAG: MATE family efflux transporter [Anaerovoracaceae bacterium]
MTEIKKENKMGTMPITKLLLTMSGPAIFSMLIQALYNIVDSIFVAQLGQSALAAVTLVFPIQMLIISVAVGTGIGINSLISRRLGAKRQEDANKAATTGLFLGIFNWIPFAIFGIFFATWFLSMFSNNPYIIKEGGDYLRIVTIGSIFVMTGINSEKIIQSTGNMILPMITIITGALVNVVLDPILIFGLLGAPKLGVAGAAVATVIAQCASMMVGVTFLLKKNLPVKVNFSNGIFNGRTIKEIYGVGGPSIIMQAIGSFMLFGINGILASFSETAVAVMGAYSKLQSFVFMPCFGVNQGSLPVMGYNYGAQNGKRLMETFKKAGIMAISIMTFGLILFQTIPVVLLSMFNANEDMIEIGTIALRAISLSFIPAAIGIVSAGLFQATGHGMISLWGSLIRQLVGILPLAILFGKIGGVSLVWWAFPLAEVFGLIYSITMIRYLFKTKLKRLGDV